MTTVNANESRKNDDIDFALQFKDLCQIIQTFCRVI